MKHSSLPGLLVTETMHNYKMASMIKRLWGREGELNPDEGIDGWMNEWMNG